MMQRSESTVSLNPNGDSLYDPYGSRHSAANDASGRYGTSFSSNSAVYVHDSDPEASKWIHRDKLARIEGNEAADYLYDVESSRWIHKDKLELIEIEEIQRAGLTLPVVNSRFSRPDGLTAPSAAGFDDYNSMDPRTPEEQAADRAAQAKWFRRNPSYSRIPIAHSSAKPVPQEVLERTSPLPRQNVSPSGSEDGRASISYPAARKRSYSAGSATLLDDSSATQSAPAPAPGKVHNPKTRPAATVTGATRHAGSRTGSMTARNRTRSNPQLHRPTTSASYSIHGGTQGKSPEGIPPWEIKSYKPDPKLPPDQQIIPTVAKRMQQEQWERDGVAASVYDRELRPLKVDDNTNAEVAAARQSLQQDAGVEWPLKIPNASQPSPKKEDPAPVPERRYSIMPPVSSLVEHCHLFQPADRKLQPSISNGHITEPPRPQPEIQRVPEVPEEEPKRKMCCCAIM